MASLLLVADALKRVLDGVEPLPAENAPLIEAEGRVLAADVAALRTQPPADMSAMDGYAVKAADVAKVPVDLKLVGRSGLDCVKRLHAHDPDMRIVVLTGFASIATAVSGTLGR